MGTFLETQCSSSIWPIYQVMSVTAHWKLDDCLLLYAEFRNVLRRLLSPWSDNNISDRYIVINWPYNTNSKSTGLRGVVLRYRCLGARPSQIFWGWLVFYPGFIALWFAPFAPSQMSCAPRINGSVPHKPISPGFLSDTPHCYRPHFHVAVHIQIC